MCNLRCAAFTRAANESESGKRNADAIANANANANRMGAKRSRSGEDPSDGLAQLRAEVEASQNRARFCRTGGSFMNLVSRQKNGRLHTGAALAEAVTPPRRRSSNNNNNNNNNQKTDDGESGGGKKKGAALVTLDEDAASKPSTDNGTNGGGDGGGGGLLFPPGFLPLDPAVTVKARSKEFEASAESMDGRLLEAIGQLKTERAEQYRRKYASLRVEGPDGNVAPRGFNAEEWRLEAEKRRIEARLVALERHRWYGRLLKLVPAGTASLGMGIGMGVGGGGAAIVGMGSPGGGGGGGGGGGSPGGGGGAGGGWGGSGNGASREPTRAEINVVAAVRDVVENGHEFNRERFFQLLLMLPMDDHVKGERLLTFIQLELGITAEEYKTFATSSGVPVPPAVEALCLQHQMQKTGGGVGGGTPMMR